MLFFVLFFLVFFGGAVCRFLLSLDGDDKHDDLDDDAIDDIVKRNKRIREIQCSYFWLRYSNGVGMERAVLFLI